MNKYKKIVLVTGGRAEFYLNLNLIKLLKINKKIKFFLLATGSHLSKKHGNTIQEIIKNKVKVHKKVALPLISSHPLATLKDIKIGIDLMSNYLKKIKPDAVILHGDRYEILASAISCFFLSIPIIHISGGELTYGSKDDTIRHVITKLSSLHFVSTKMHKKRVIQLGEHPSKVFNVGNFGVERINFLKKKNKIIKNKKKLEQTLKFKFNKKNILITLHPDTYKTRNQILRDIQIVFREINKLKQTNFIFTSPNSDQNNDLIESEIKKFIKKNKSRSLYVASLGDINYYSLLNFVDCVLGNSSSGITEVPEFNIPTINIGDRQSGRPSSKSVINCTYNEKSIRDSLKKIYNKNFKTSIKKAKNPYLSKNGSRSIIKIILKTNFNSLLPKKFYDV